MFQTFGLIFLLVMLVAMTHAIITVSSSSKKKWAKAFWIIFSNLTVIGQGSWFFYLLQHEELKKVHKWSWIGGNVAVLLIFALFMEVKSNFSLFTRRRGKSTAGKAKTNGQNSAPGTPQPAGGVPPIASQTAELQQKLGIIWGYLFFVLLLVLYGTIIINGIFFSE